MSNHFQYSAGLGHVGSYQVSGRPWATGSINCKVDAQEIAQLDFPNVTSWVIVTNNDSADANLRIGFSSGSVAGEPASNTSTGGGRGHGNRFLEIAADGRPCRLDLKVTQVFLSGSNNCSVVAGLTGIEIKNIDFQPNLSPSGKNWSGSAGV